MIFAKFLFCLVAFVVGAVNALPVEEDGRIVNGQEISINQAPYMIQIRRNGALFCGASLVAPSYIITAAHCVYGVDVRSLDIVAGATTVAEKGIQRKVVRYTIHPEYTPQTMHSDVAIFQLNAPILNVPILPLCRQQLNEGDYVQVSGWGQLGENKGLSYNLRTVMLPVRSQKTCTAEFGPYVKQHMFCTSGWQAIGSCSGDSGGPAVYKGQLCGLVSFGYKCGQVGYTGAYTNVFSLLKFITQFISGK